MKKVSYCRKFTSAVQVVVAGAVLTGGAGCTKVASHYVIDPAVTSSEMPDSDGLKRLDPLNLDTHVFFEDLVALKLTEEAAATQSEGAKPEGADTKQGGDTKKDAPTARTALARIAAAMSGEKKNAEEARRLRNRLQNDILIHSAKICEAHKARIMAAKSTFDFGFGLAATLLSGASAAVGGEAAKTALSALSAASGATGTAIDANFYQDLLAAGIAREIDRLRANELAKIKKRWADSIDDYDLSQAIYDTVVYHSTCSFSNGIMSLAGDHTPKQRTKQDLTNEIMELDKEKATLEKAYTSGPAAFKEEAERRLELINGELKSLILLRKSAPGVIETSVPAPASKENGAAPAVGSPPPPVEKEKIDG